MIVLILLTLTTLTGGTTTESQHYHIVPVNSTHLCQHYQAGSCLTLDQLSSQLQQTGDITLNFLPGDHLLTWDMTISGANNVLFISEQSDNHSSRITCSEGMGIVIQDTKLFTMSKLEIHRCNSRKNGTVFLYRTSVVIQSSAFTNNTVIQTDCIDNCTSGGALHIESTYNGNESILIDSCIFSFNTVRGLVSGNGHNSGFGGAIRIQNIDTANMSNTFFISNSAPSGVGGALSSEYVTHTRVSNCSFVNNTAYSGGGISITSDKYSSLVSSNNMYLYNKANSTGGGVIIKNSEQLKVLFESDKFHSNRALSGSTVHTKALYDSSSPPLSITFDNCIISRNLGGVSVLRFQYTIIKFTGYNILMDNSGSLRSKSSHVIFTDRTLFMNNTGRNGGAITSITSTITFESSSQTLISNNKASRGGGIYVEQGTLSIYGSANLTENVAKDAGGGIYASKSTIQIVGGSQFSSINSNVAEEDGGGVYLLNSNYNAANHVTISGNTARRNGGGMFLSPTSTVILVDSNSSLTLSKNSAKRGGGLYVEDNCREGVACFLILRQHIIESLLWFWKNNATEAGNDIYGGMLDMCNIILRHYQSELDYEVPPYNGIDYFKIYARFDRSFMANNLPLQNVSDYISSNPHQVCFCDIIHIDCGIRDLTMFKKKGERFTVSLVALDQAGKPVKATIISTLQSNNADIGRLKGEQRLREISDRCTTLEYNVFSSNNSVVMEVYADGSCRNQENFNQKVNIKFLPCTCPAGFEHIPLDTNCSCHCDKRLVNYISNCLTDNGTVQIDSNVWIKYLNSTNTTDYIMHKCPFDYCVQKPVSLSLADQDEQCAFNRTGTLCGECKEGLSLVFSTSNCQQCTNYYIFLILPFALAGIALVAFILVLNMTVATGTIHGLIFYTNILAATRSIFIPSDSPAFLSVFISWLNLDLGIETCFYSGMDSYGKLLLQLVFPAYVFLLIAIIMVLCDHSQRIAGLFGKRNPEATLYTLVLLSYSKLIRLIITALQFTTINNPDGSQDIVWLHNANVLYFTISHIPRFLAAIIITLLGAVYTTLLLFGQLFNRCSEYRLMKWTTHKYYIHFLKAHHAPFSDKHRYWVGLLLLVRLAHYLITAFASILIIILSASFIAFSLILFKQLIKGKIYRSSWLDLLETLFLVNLCILGVVTIAISHYTNWSQTAMAIVSMSVTFIAFLALVLYHILHSCGVRLDKVLKQALASTNQHRPYQLVPNNERDEEEDLDDEPLIELGHVNNDTDTIVTDPDRYITPPIIRSAVQDDQLREPALDDLIPITPEDYLYIN